MIKVNGENISYKIWSGGEIDICVKPVYGRGVIEALIDNSVELVRLLLVVDAIKRLGNWNEGIVLRLYYVPYARQDRVCSIGEPLSISIVADLINSIGAYKVFIYDPHSDVTPALIKNSIVVNQYQIISKSTLSLVEYGTLIAPDAGAYKKLSKFPDHHLAFANKIRQKNGSVEILDVTPLEGDNYLVIDDICDGGRTFISLASKIKKKGKLDLYVTHGIFSQGSTALLENYNTIYCMWVWNKNNPSVEKAIKEGRIVELSNED